MTKSPEIVGLVTGALSVGYLVGAVFFLKFWRRTRDGLFAAFAAAFVLMAINQSAPLVFGIPDERYGEEVCAWVIVVDGGELDEEEIRTFCRGRIARYKVPRHIRFVDAFPLTVTGKVQKFRMREHEIAERGLAAVAATRTA